MRKQEVRLTKEQIEEILTLLREKATQVENRERAGRLINLARKLCEQRLDPLAIHGCIG